jgi:hypothetical protein
VVEIGPRWRRREVHVSEVPDDAKPALLKRYLDRWFWEVRGHVGGLTPESTDADLRSAAPSIPVFVLERQGTATGALEDAAEMTSSRAC